MMFSPYNPCCTGSFYGTGCTPDCAESIALDAYSRAWADAMSGIVSFCGGNQPAIKYEPPAPLDWGEAP